MPDTDRELMLERLRATQGGTMDTVWLAERLGWTRPHARRVLREMEADGLVTSQRTGGRTHGRPLYWTLTDAAG